ncbi:MAG TPA: SpoIIE family protein phosphatase, partial [Acidobacteriaceae bacterium]|nr:SpoIIE family protein phosphatase [Acidobacteriaceae bacterium]
DFPNEQRTAPQIFTVALRIWHAPLWSHYRHGGLQGSAEVGRSDLIHTQFDTEEQAHLWQYSDDFDLGALDLLAFAVALVLFLTRRTEREFLWFALLVLGQGAGHFVTAWGHLHASYILWTDFLQTVFEMVFLGAALMFFRTFFRGKWNNAFVFALVCLGLFGLLYPIGWMGALTVFQQNLFSLLLILPVYGWIIVFVRQQARRKQPDARVLRGPVTFLFLAAVYSQVIWTVQTAGLTVFSNFVVRWQHPLYLTLNDVAEVVFLVAMLVILLRRFTLRSREQDRVESELEAARSVQQVLVPESLPQIQGLSIGTAYHPAQEVGGDFFQILPLDTGATLIVIGDVAGKGLPAALQVSLAVGTLRALAEGSHSPAAILAGLNRSLQGRSAGFTTCLALHFSTDRTVLTFANAGHIAPYVNGFELRTEPNLPLGLVPEIVFDEVRYALNPGDHLTVLTDGVPEAMHHRELFGFERTGLLSRQPAAQIAAAARDFGQTDDITVLTVDIVTVPASHTEQLVPALQPA